MRRHRLNVAIHTTTQLPRTHVPPLHDGRNSLIRAIDPAGCKEHLVTDERFAVHNPETGKPMRLNGQPYTLSIALCGRFTEWLEPYEGAPTLCPLCVAVLQSRGGMAPQGANIAEGVQ